MYVSRGKRNYVGVLAAVIALCAAAEAAPNAPRLKPPAPGPQYLSHLDQDRLKSIHQHLERKEYSLAVKERQFIDDPTARSLAAWLYYMAKDPGADIGAADAFLRNHADWPAITRIQRYIEARMDNDVPSSVIADFFADRAPQTGNGKIQLARAYLTQGRQQEATDLIRDAWVNHNFTVAQERKILTAYRSRLRRQDHADRVDRMLWSIQVTNARRTFPYLSKSDRRVAEARAALLMRSSKGPELFNALSLDERLAPGPLYAAVRYYRRTDQEPRAIALAKQATPPASSTAKDRWWTERRILAQWAIRNGRFNDAYALAANHGGAEGADFSDAEFYAGWIALRFLSEPERATLHFEAMTGAVSSPISVSRGHYWLGRAAEAANDETRAQDHYETAAAHHYSYYGQLAAEKLARNALGKPFDPPITPTPEEIARFNGRPSVSPFRMLSDLNLDYELMVFAYHLDDQLESAGEYIAMAEITNGEGAPHLTVRAGKASVQRGAFAAHAAYPMVLVPNDARRFIEPEITLGLSRQESEFNPRAYSSAGARGMMQLIPSTAQITARRAGLPYRRSALLDDPYYNMTIGSAHLAQLLDRFDGSLIMTFAAYNAGAHRADRWAEEYGDPRNGDVDPVDWVELIPFSETRNYVQRVLENIQVYRGLLSEEPIPGKLSGDIERGGPPDRIAQTFTPSAALDARASAIEAPGPLIDAPAQTVKLAAAFREKHQAERIAIAAINRLGRTTSPVTDAGSPATDPAPAPQIQNDPRRRGVPAAPVEPIAAAPDKEAGAEPETAPEPTPADHEVTAPTPHPQADTETGAQVRSDDPPPDTAAATAPKADPIAGLLEDTIAAEQTVAEASAALPPPAATSSPENAALAAEIIDDAAAALEISGETDRDDLAAAILRGLEELEAQERMEAEAVALPSANPVTAPPAPCPAPDGEADGAISDGAPPMNEPKAAAKKSNTPTAKPGSKTPAPSPTKAPGASTAASLNAKMIDQLRAQAPCIK